MLCLQLTARVISNKAVHICFNRFVIIRKNHVVVAQNKGLSRLAGLRKVIKWVTDKPLEWLVGVLPATVSLPTDPHNLCKDYLNFRYVLKKWAPVC